MSSDSRPRRISALRIAKRRSPYAQYGSRHYARVPRTASGPTSQKVAAAVASQRDLVRSKRRVLATEDQIAAFRSVVMHYFRDSGRDHLPWRKTRDPYAILVSEMMLQQTQVDRVIPYYERWMQRFPDAKALAGATLSEVLTLWSGLGYNRRAKYLHEAAKILAPFNMDGRHSLTYAELRALPGVGDYTAKAVRVFAYNEPEVLIETNVRAVFIHHFFPRGRNVSDARLLPLIAQALEGQDPRTWYAALMDYGTFLKATHPNPSRKSKHHTKQSAFEGSLRQVRGAVLKHLIAGAATSEEIARRAGCAKASVAIALSGLQRDGLVEVRRLSWRLA